MIPVRRTSKPDILKQKADTWLKELQEAIINLEKIDLEKIENSPKPIKKEIEELKGQLTGDMFQDMELKDKIHNLEMKLNGTKPTDSHFDCVGCGS